MSYVFVSYFRENKSEIAKLLKRLDAAKAPYWIDEAGMEGGELWREKISRKINDASAFLLCLSKQFYERPNSYVHQELEIALKKAATLDASVTWIVPVLLDNTPIPKLNISNTRHLSDHHVIKLDGRGMDACVERLRALVSNPSLNQASVRMTSTNLTLAPFIEVNNRLLTSSGGWIETSAYAREYMKLHPKGYGPETILDVFAVKRDSRRDFSVPAGPCTVRVAFMKFEQASGQYGPVGGPSWIIFASNTLRFQLRAREQKTLLVRDTPGTGFLWRNKPVSDSYYLTEA